MVELGLYYLSVCMYVYLPLCLAPVLVIADFATGPKASRLYTPRAVGGAGPASGALEKIPCQLPHLSWEVMLLESQALLCGSFAPLLASGILWQYDVAL